MTKKSMRPTKSKLAEETFVGMWENHYDIDDTTKWLRELRGYSRTAFETMLSISSRIFLCILLLILVYCRPLHAQTEDDFTSTDYYNKGLLFKRQNDIKSAIIAFEKVVNMDKRRADAYHQLALLYSELGTIHSRFKATSYLKKALRLDSKNVLYNLDMAKLALKKEMRGEAKTYFKKVIEYRPKNADALYHLGVLEIDDMLWYKDLINPKEDIVFSFDDAAKEHRHQAKSYFLKAIQSEPGFALPYYHLAFVEYEFSNYDSMIIYLENGIENNPEDANLALFMGLAWHRKHRYALAQKYFEQSKNLMKPEELRELVSVYPVLDPSTSQEYSGLDEEAKKKFASAFWRQRDPLLLTDVNERVLEHYSRLAYVNMRFGDPQRGINGWETDQGKTYIRFGAPEHKYRTRPSVGVVFNNPSLINDKPYLNTSKEVWVYDDFHLTFEDEFIRRKFEFKRDFQPNNDSKIIFENLIERQPESYEFDTNGSKFDVPYLIAQFMEDGGQSRIEIFYGIPSNYITFYRYGSDIKVKLKKGFFVFNKDWEEISRSVTVTNKLPVSIQDMNGKFFKVGRFQSKLASGPCNIVLELLDQYTQNYGHVREQLVTRNFDKSKIEMSDIVLAEDIIEDDSSNSPYRFNNLRIIPNLFRTFRSDDPIFIYFEIYNLRQNHEGETRFNIETTLDILDAHESTITKFASSIGKILGLTESKQGNVGTTHEYYGDSQTQHIYYAIRFSDTAAGEYQLKIKIIDIYSDTSVEKEVVLRILQ